MVFQGLLLSFATNNQMRVCRFLSVVHAFCCVLFFRFAYANLINTFTVLVHQPFSISVEIVSEKKMNSMYIRQLIIAIKYTLHILKHAKTSKIVLMILLFFQ